MTRKMRTYSEMQNELNDIINWFESDSFDIESALIKYNEADKLVKEMKRYLTEAENRINKLIATSNPEK